MASGGGRAGVSGPAGSGGLSGALAYAFARADGCMGVRHLVAATPSFSRPAAPAPSPSASPAAEHRGRHRKARPHVVGLCGR